MPDEPLASVVVPAHNAAGVLPACLEALAAQTWPAERLEVIVVDDGSTDGTAEVAMQAAAGARPTPGEARPVSGDAPPAAGDGRAAAGMAFRVLSMPARGGPAAARNAGIDAAAGELVLFTDADCVPDPEWAAEITRPLRDDPAVSGVKGIYRTGQRSLAARFAQAEFEERYRKLAKHRYIDFVDTYCAAFRREALQAVGKFDTGFPLPNNEDVDLSYRLSAAGYRMVFHPAAVVRHRHRTTLWGYLKLKVSRGFWRMKVYRRYPGKSAGDSYTPGSLRIQLMLAAAAILLAASAALLPGPWPLRGLAACVALFAASTAPFTWRLVRRDPPLAAAAPILLGLRALAILSGMVAGAIRFRPFLRKGAGRR